MNQWLTLAQIAAVPDLTQRPVARDGGNMIARARFLTDVRAWYLAFREISGMRIALYFDNCYQFVTALYGAWHAGKVVYLPGDAQSATLARLLPQVDACAGDLPRALQPKPVSVSEPFPAPLDMQTTELLVYTSGSSGEPVAIRKCLRQLDAEVHALQREFGAHLGAAAVYATVSHQHIYGLLFHALWPLAAGRPIVLPRLSYPEEMAARLSQEPCILVSSPAHLKRLPETLDWRAVRPMLRGIFSSGGPLPAEASQAIHEQLGHSPIEVYGSSETGGIAWRQRATDGERWRLFPAIAMRIDDELLAVRSPYLWDDDWWQTSDRVRVLDTEDGSGFVLLGRMDRIAKIEEKRVSLTAVERALLACPEISQVRALVLERAGSQRLAVVAVPSADGWALLHAQGKTALNESLRRALLQSVERTALPRNWRYVQALPVNAQGKTTEAMLAALFRSYLPPLTWLQRETGLARASMAIGADLAGFDGHFPAALILPGVVQLDWAAELGGQCFGPLGCFQRCDVLKFQQPVLPGMQVELELLWNEADRVLGFRYTSAAGTHASGRMVFAGQS